MRLSRNHAEGNNHRWTPMNTDQILPAEDHIQQRKPSGFSEVDRLQTAFSRDEFMFICGFR
jgi:hypothetical protein